MGSLSSPPCYRAGVARVDIVYAAVLFALLLMARALSTSPHNAILFLLFGSLWQYKGVLASLKPPCRKSWGFFFGGGRCWGMWLLIERLPGSTKPWFQSTAPNPKRPLEVHTYNLSTQEVRQDQKVKVTFTCSSLRLGWACLQNTIFEGHLMSCPVSTSMH